MDRQRPPFADSIGSGYSFGANGFPAANLNNQTDQNAGQNTGNFIMMKPNAHRLTPGSVFTSEGLNSMPFLIQAQANMMRTLGRQGAQGTLAGGSDERRLQGQSSCPCTPRARPADGYNGYYEGDTSMFRGCNGKVSNRQLFNTLRINEKKDLPELEPEFQPHLQFKHVLDEIGVTELSEQSEHSESTDNIDGTEAIEATENTEQIDKREAQNERAKKQKRQGQPNIWEQLLSRKRGQQVKSVLDTCSQHRIFISLLMLLQYMLLQLQFFAQFFERFNPFVLRIRGLLLLAKFRVRGFIRAVLWRLISFKYNDMLLFLVVMLLAPWLFIISLVGCVLSMLLMLRPAVIWRSLQSGAVAYPGFGLRI